jgi:Sortase domain
VIRSRCWPGIVLLIVGIVVLGSSLAWLRQDRQPAAEFTQPVGATPSATTMSLAGTATSVPSVLPEIGNPIIPAAQWGGESTAAAAAARATVAGPPTWLTIPTLTVDAPVDPVLSAGRVLRPPDDPLRVGWWMGSSPAGSQQGSTVLVGHVDTAAAGPGALFRLTDLEPGAEIGLYPADDNGIRYAVTALTD